MSDVIVLKADGTWHIRKWPGEPPETIREAFTAEAVRVIGSAAEQALFGGSLPQDYSRDYLEPRRRTFWRERRSVYREAPG